LNPADQAPKRLQFELHGDMQEVMQRVKAVQAFLLDAGCNAACAQQLAVVAEEILSNIVREAWAGRDAGHCGVVVDATVRQGSVDVGLRTEDDGVAFNPLEAEPPDLDASLDERSIGGLGILFVRTMTDTQTYHRTKGRNIFEVRKLCPLATAAG
jgi:anti-sigma regulatory factor (Ser/Thr protein kinase)